MRHFLAVFLLFALVGCTSYNDESWNGAIERLQSIVSNIKSADPNSLIQTDIADIQWNLLHNSEDSSNNNELPPNLTPSNNENNNSNGSDSGAAIIGLEVVYTDINTNEDTTLTYKFSDAVGIEETTILLLASQEDLDASSTSLNSTKILKIDTNEETVDETTSATTLTISGTIQRITGTAGVNLLNQLKSEDTESISVLTDIGKTEAFFLLRIEYPLGNVTQTDYILSFATYLMQGSENTWTETVITNQ